MLENIALIIEIAKGIWRWGTGTGRRYESAAAMRADAERPHAYGVDVPHPPMERPAPRLIQVTKQTKIKTKDGEITANPGDWVLAENGKIITSKGRQ